MVGDNFRNTPDKLSLIQRQRAARALAELAGLRSQGARGDVGTDLSGQSYSKATPELHRSDKRATAGLQQKFKKGIHMDQCTSSAVRARPADRQGRADRRRQHAASPNLTTILYFPQSMFRL